MSDPRKRVMKKAGKKKPRGKYLTWAEARARGNLCHIRAHTVVGGKCLDCVAEMRRQIREEPERVRADLIAVGLLSEDA